MIETYYGFWALTDMAFIVFLSTILVFLEDLV